MSFSMRAQLWRISYLLPVLLGSIVMAACTITTVDGRDDDGHDDDYGGADDGGDDTTAATTGNGTPTTGTGTGGGSVPAEIVGDWIYVGSESAHAHTFTADGTWSEESLLDPSSCVTFDKIDITRDGVVDVSGGRITFSPSSANVATTDCSSDTTTKPGSLETFTQRYVLGTDPETGGPTLTLTDEADPTVVLTYERP